MAGRRQFEAYYEGEIDLDGDEFDNVLDDDESIGDGLIPQNRNE